MMHSVAMANIQNMALFLPLLGLLGRNGGGVCVCFSSIFIYYNSVLMSFGLFFKVIFVGIVGAWSVGPEGFETVKISRLRKEHVNHHVDVV